MAVLRPVALVLAVLAAGCTRPAPAPPPAASEARRASEVREVALEEGWITLRLQIPRTPPGRKPVVISPVGDAALLLGAGAILADYKVHWERLAALRPAAPPPSPATPPEAPRTTVGSWLLAAPTPKTVGKGYFEIITHDATVAVPKVLDHLVGLQEVDPARIGIAGVSTRGFEALQAAAADRRLRAVAALVACGDYHGFLHLSSLGMNGAPLDLDPAYDAWLRAQAPALHPERLVHAAVLLVNGTADVAVPFACAARTAAAFRRAYARAGVPERFRWVVLSDAGHVVGDRAAAEVLAWWHRWLLRP
jgi:hypothetical protein